MGFGCVVFLDAAPHHIISYQGSCSVACRLPIWRIRINYSRFFIFSSDLDVHEIDWLCCVLVIYILQRFLSQLTYILNSRCSEGFPQVYIYV